MLSDMDRLARLLDALLAPGVPLAITTHACFGQLVLLTCALLADMGNGGNQLARWSSVMPAVTGVTQLDPEALPTALMALAGAAGAGAFCGIGLGRRPCGWAGAALVAALVSVPWIAPAARLATAGLPGLLAPLAVVPAWGATVLITGWRR